MNFFGQAQQDKFALEVNNYKENGYFVDLGSNHPIKINNTYLLEKDFEWSGLMIEYDKSYLPLYQKHRVTSTPIIADATTLDYSEVFDLHRVPKIVDFLSIDLEASNGSSLRALELIEKVMDRYKFRAICFEHDVWRTRTQETWKGSLDLLCGNGYEVVFENIHNKKPKYVYEHWFVHPELVDMTYIQLLRDNNRINYEKNDITGTSIGWNKIQYPSRQVLF